MLDPFTPEGNPVLAVEPTLDEDIFRRDRYKKGQHWHTIEGAFYFGIGILFLLYGFYRAIKKPFMSVVLTVISLGTRVLLAYSLSPVFGVTAIWAAVPIGWGLADITGILYYLKHKNELLRMGESQSE